MMSKSAEHGAAERETASEERQAFLLKLTDALRPLTDPIAVQRAAMRLMTTHFDVMRASYFEVEADQDSFALAARYEVPDAAPIPDRLRLSDFSSDISAAYRSGRTLVAPDTENEPVSEAQRAAYRAIGVRAWAGVPLVKDGALIAIVGVQSRAPRAWPPEQIRLLEDVAERTWSAVERARAEAALKESEAKYRGLFESIDTGYCIIEVLFGDAGEAVDYIFHEANPAFEKQTGLANAIGRSMRALAPSHEPFWYETYGRIARTGKAERFEHRADALGRWYSVYAFRVGAPAQNRVAILFEDIKDRKRAETALHESEQRFSQFANACSGALWIRDAATRVMEYVSPAFSQIYGAPSEAVLGDIKHWAAMIVPEDRALALDHIEQARAGRAVVHEFRIQRPSDRIFRWIRNTDFPLFDADGRVQRIGGIAEDVTETKLAVEHQGVLLAELQHRVRNIMAMIRSITARTAQSAETVPEYAALMSGRLITFTRVQALLTRAANVGVDLMTIVHDELSAQAAHEGQFRVEGPDIILAPKAAENLTLAVHELVTNALKYGALASLDGHVHVRWTVSDRYDGPWLVFDWCESCGAGPARVAGPRRQGFGRELIEGRIPYELGGHAKLMIAPEGAHCHLEFPLTEGASILETDAPQPARVFGGALDMTGEVDLSGQRVLVVEDDYYLASDTARALRGAGAEVLGPCPTEEAALAAVAGLSPSAAILDLNLGTGPSFAMARDLRARGVPFVFMTGYDDDVIPAEFNNVIRLRKPVELRQIVAVTAKVLGLHG